MLQAAGEMQDGSGLDADMRRDGLEDAELHELSICQALLAQVAELAMDRGAQSVQRITIEVGPLSGVDPTLLADAFEILRAGSCAARAVLCIEPIVVTVQCALCDARSVAAANRLLCAVCGAYRTRVIAGDELRLRRVELLVDESAAIAMGLPADRFGEE